MNFCKQQITYLNIELCYQSFHVIMLLISTEIRLAIGYIEDSMSDFRVMREQYCCCQRWTRMEKYLALIVAILAIVIIGLIIAVGVVANHTDTPIDKYFMTLKF